MKVTHTPKKTTTNRVKKVTPPVAKPVEVVTEKAVPEAKGDGVVLSKVAPEVTPAETKAVETPAASSEKAETPKKDSTEILIALQDVDQGSRKKILTDYNAALQLGETTQEQKDQFLAAVALNHSTKEIRKRMPSASKQEIREAAKSDPELAKWTNLADTSAEFLPKKAAKSEEKPKPDPTDNVQKMANDRAKMDRIKDIYKELREHMIESAKKRHQKLMAARSEIYDMNAKGIADRQATRDHQASESRRLLLGTQNRSGRFVY